MTDAWTPPPLHAAPAAPPAAAAGPRDPAPSRMQYRLQRLWLTPLVRALLRLGLPVAAIALAAGAYLASEDRRAALGAQLADWRHAVQHRPEFMVTLVAINGASPRVAGDVRAALALTLPVSSFELDLPAARARVEAVQGVAQASLRIAQGVLQVDVTERTPVAVWRTETGLTLVDVMGHPVAGLARRSDRPDLPLIAGEGADARVPEALAILAAAQPVAPRIRGLVRVGLRRWDLVLDRAQRIQLPERGAVRALERLIALDQAQDLLARDILTVDLRNEHRPTLRLTPTALNEFRRSRGIDTEASAL